MDLNILQFFNPKFERGGEGLSKATIYIRSKNLFRSIVWHYWLRKEIDILWPRGWIDLGDGVSQESADPNDFYRKWLESTIGRQGISWEWRLHETSFDRLVIKFRREEDATLFALKFT